MIGTSAPSYSVSLDADCVRFVYKIENRSATAYEYVDLRVDNK